MINLLCAIILLVLFVGPDPRNLILITGIIMMVVGVYLLVLGILEILKELRKK